MQDYEAKSRLVALIQRIHARGWSPGTGGNFSFVAQTQPLQLWMTPSGIHKDTVEPDSLVLVDEFANVVKGSGAASAEALLHVKIATLWGATVILHSHSVWNTLASLNPEGVNFEGFEMIKAFRGQRTHETRYPVPVLENSQDIATLAAQLVAVHHEHPETSGFLLKGHGLYTWGDSFDEAQKHVEAFEFLLETTVRAKRLGLLLS